mmetsp:Transcript_58508/g.104754  ORF Transcript_58508/g.104754 Transcript_58508/m.104754 type:complete len:89 (-) Transcript_58508:143-409(-)
MTTVTEGHAVDPPIEKLFVTPEGQESLSTSATSKSPVEYAEGASSIYLEHFQKDLKEIHSVIIDGANILDERMTLQTNIKLILQEEGT